MKKNLLPMKNGNFLSVTPRANFSKGGKQQIVATIRKPLRAGRYELKDGRQIIVGKGGVITAIL
jgi:hypothetical protein